MLGKTPREYLVNVKKLIISFFDGSSEITNLTIIFKRLCANKHFMNFLQYNMTNIDLKGDLLACVFAQYLEPGTFQQMLQAIYYLPDAECTFYHLQQEKYHFRENIFVFDDRYDEYRRSFIC